MSKKDETGHQGMSEMEKALYGDLNSAVTDDPAMDPDVVLGGFQIDPEPGSTPPVKEQVRVLDKRNFDEVRAAENTASGQYAMALAGLKNSMETRKVLYGRVVAVQRRKARQSKARKSLDETMGAVVIYGGCIRIFIAYEDLYLENPIDITSVDVSNTREKTEILARQRGLIEGMNSLEIPFVVTRVSLLGDVSIGEYEVEGSRNLALRMQQWRMFDPKNPQRIREMGLYDATVMSVGRFGVYVTLGGVDKSIWVKDLTYRFILRKADLDQICHVGGTIPVVVTRILKKDNGLYSLELSGKHAEMEFSKPKQGNLLQIGDMTTGTVTSAFYKKDANGRDTIAIYAWLDLFDVPAVAKGIHASSLGRYPTRGESGRFEIKGFAPNGMTIVECRGLDGPQCMFNRK